MITGANNADNTYILTLNNKNMDKFELEQTISGKNAMAYMAELLEKNEKQEIEIERGKLSVSILKQMNNRSRLLLDAAKFELKKGAENEVKN